ncbi:MAG TPA: potassium transporter TrkG [Victivallales bacterium]|nr:potassium transporter TrkG [Victivallales bacterium]
MKKVDIISSRNPAHLLALSFLCIIVLGAAALQFPMATYGDIALVDSFFISVSAVCVTGLASVDVATTFTFFGQVIIIILIQLGGLGIMTFAAIIIWVMRQRVSLNERVLLEYAFLGSEKNLQLKDFVFFILKYTFIVELLGMIGFYYSFDHLEFSDRIFQSVFQGISAFCNAGFSLNSTNMVMFRNSYSANLVTMGLIIFGGIGFIVVFEIRNKIGYLLKNRKSRYRVSMFTLHTWTVLNVTVFLILLGGISIFFFERISNNSSITILESFFQSVSCRTAGFNTVDIGTLHSSTLLIMIFLMFVGGSPGSTAGGIKTTTFGVLLFIVFMGRNNFEDVTARNRTIPKSIVYQALVIFLFSSFVIFIATMFLCVFQNNFEFVRLFYEVVSAFGTVGLSTGITQSLFASSKWVLMIVMFTGRIGSITIFSMFANREPLNIKKAEERLIVG